MHIHRPHSSTLFPYTTLFRSLLRARHPSSGVHDCAQPGEQLERATAQVGSADRKSTRLNSSHVANSHAVFRLKKKKEDRQLECCRIYVSRKHARRLL